MSACLLHFTDIHLFADDEGQSKGINTLESFHSVLNLARVNHPDAHAAVLTGDLSQDASAGSYERLAWELEPGPCPAYVLKGNHDDSAAMWVGLTGQKVDVRTDRSFFLGAWQIVLLDSTVPDQVHGALTDATLEWLDRALAAHPRHHALICLHHPPIALGSLWMDAIGLANGDALFAVIDRHPNVRAVLWGHVHQEVDQHHREVRLLSSPSTGVQFAPGEETFALHDAAPGYRWLELADDGVIRTGVVRLPEYSTPVPGPGEGLIVGASGDVHTG